MKLKVHQILLFALIGFISFLPLMGLVFGWGHNGGGGGP